MRLLTSLRLTFLSFFFTFQNLYSFATTISGIREYRVLIPVTDSLGRTTNLHGRICRPKGNMRYRLVVINHGTPRGAANRRKMKLSRCDSEAARWFIQRDYVVIFALRRGYGATGGPWVETYGKCEEPKYTEAGLETARDIEAIVRYGTALPYVQSDGAIVIGQSAGGWGSIAYNSMPHPHADAFVVMAGGRGGHEHGVPNANCRPDTLFAAAETFGKTSTTPMLWIYAENDSYFGPVIAQSLHDAFVRGGGRAHLIQPASFGEDGHHLFFGKGGSAIWGPLVEQYLSSRHPPTQLAH